jgi:hypothetical protein
MTAVPPHRPTDGPPSATPARQHYRTRRGGRPGAAAVPAVTLWQSNPSGPGDPKAPPPPSSPPSTAIACGRPARSLPRQGTPWIGRSAPGEPLCHKTQMLGSTVCGPIHSDACLHAPAPPPPPAVSTASRCHTSLCARRALGNAHTAIQIEHVVKVYTLKKILKTANLKTQDRPPCP